MGFILSRDMGMRKRGAGAAEPILNDGGRTGEKAHMLILLWNRGDGEGGGQAQDEEVRPAKLSSFSIAHWKDIEKFTTRRIVIQMPGRNHEAFPAASFLKPVLVLIAALFVGMNAAAQLKVIDPAKLPQNDAVKSAYKTALDLEPMTRSWSDKWRYSTPKDQVAAQLTKAYQELIAAEPTAPGNEELILLAGLVAHFAYNVDVDDAYPIAVQSFEKAHELAPTDFRPVWFLGMHQCLSDDVNDGMNRMLSVEDGAPWQNLPIDFWDDYINCSTISKMPAHTLRAIDHVVHLGASRSDYDTAADLANGRYAATNAEETYPARQAWQAQEIDKEVRFTGQVCGLSFATHSDWHIDIRDVGKGNCTETIETGPYPSKTGQGIPTILVLTRMAKPGESLSDFAQSLMKKYQTAQPVAASSCPADPCLAYEIRDVKEYAPEGGAHFLAVAFGEPPPDLPGLLFEKPEGPPKPDPSGKVTYYSATPILHRFPGTLFTIVLLDSNETIFQAASADYTAILKSIQLD